MYPLHLETLIPVVPGCEIHDDPLAPLCAACRARIAAEGPTGFYRGPIAHALA